MKRLLEVFPESQYLLCRQSCTHMVITDSPETSIPELSSLSSCAAASIILSREMCSFGGSIIIDHTHRWNHALKSCFVTGLTELLFLTPVAELQSERVHAGKIQRGTCHSIAQVFLGFHNHYFDCYKQCHCYVVGAGEILHAESQGSFPDLPLSHPKIDQKLTAPEQGVTAHLQTWAMEVSVSACSGV